LFDERFEEIGKLVEVLLEFLNGGTRRARVYGFLFRKEIFRMAMDSLTIGLSVVLTHIDYMIKISYVNKYKDDFNNQFN
jgi:hypothetical protein